MESCFHILINGVLTSANQILTMVTNCFLSWCTFISFDFKWWTTKAYGQQSQILRRQRVVNVYRYMHSMTWQDRTCLEYVWLCTIKFKHHFLVTHCHSTGSCCTSYNDNRWRATENLDYNISFHGAFLIISNLWICPLLWPIFQEN